jgi:hypothetical protein
MTNVSLAGPDVLTGPADMTASGRRLTRDAIAHVMAAYATTETGWGPA